MPISRLRLMETAWTSMRTSPSFGSGTGMSSIRRTSRPPCSRTTTAFIEFTLWCPPLDCSTTPVDRSFRPGSSRWRRALSLNNYVLADAFSHARQDFIANELQRVLREFVLHVSERDHKQDIIDRAGLYLVDEGVRNTGGRAGDCESSFDLSIEASIHAPVHGAWLPVSLNSRGRNIA